LLALIKIDKDIRIREEAQIEKMK